MVARQKPGRIADVIGQLGADIVGGRVPEGGSLPTEPRLERHFRVSRSVVREAMRTLVAKGLVDVRPRVGTQVRPRTTWNLLDPQVLDWMIGAGRKPDRKTVEALVEVRDMIEPAGAALAAARSTRAQQRAILRALEEMEASIGKVEAAVAADKRFHLAILAATGNPILAAFQPMLERVLDCVFVLSIEKIDWFAQNLGNHRRVAEEIAARRPEAARLAMTDVLAFTRANVVQRRATSRARKT